MLGRFIPVHFKVRMFSYFVSNGYGLSTIISNGQKHLPNQEEFPVWCHVFDVVSFHFLMVETQCLKILAYDVLYMT